MLKFAFFLESFPLDVCNCGNAGLGERAYLDVCLICFLCVAPKLLEIRSNALSNSSEVSCFNS